MRTREEIINMQAGEEMDILIAENVMGWHEETERGFLYWLDAENRFMCGVGKYDGFEDEEDFHILKFHPSESISWAWNVVEVFTEDQETSGCDVVKVCRRDLEWLGKWSCNFGKGNEAFAETVPLAICRAALLAVMELL